MNNLKGREIKNAWVIERSTNPNSVVFFYDPMKGTMIHIGPGMSKLSLFVLKSLQKFIRTDENSEKSISLIKENLEKEIETSLQ